MVSCFSAELNFTTTRSLGVGHGWCGHAAQVRATMSVLVLSASPWSCAFEIRISAYEIIKIGCAKHVHASRSLTCHVYSLL